MQELPLLGCFKVISLFCIFSLLPGCSSVKASDFVGKWIISDLSKGNLPSDLKNANASVIFAADGTFQASNLPGLFYVPPAPVNLDSGKGEWKLAIYDGRIQIQLNFLEINGHKLKQIYGTQFHTSNWFSKTKCFYYVGDPDEGKKVEFKRSFEP